MLETLFKPADFGSALKMFLAPPFFLLLKIILSEREGIASEDTGQRLRSRLDLSLRDPTIFSARDGKGKSKNGITLQHKLQWRGWVDRLIEDCRHYHLYYLGVLWIFCNCLICVIGFRRFSILISCFI